MINRIIIGFLTEHSKITATQKLSGTKYPTMNLGYQAMRKIEKELENYSKSVLNNNHNSLSQTIQSMKEKFNKYWHPMKEFLAVGLVMDPCYKM